MSADVESDDGKNLFEVKFKGGVTTVEVSIEDERIPLTRGAGNEWTGKSDEIAVPPSRKVGRVLEFRGLSFTDYSLVIRYEGTKVDEEEGRSDQPRFRSPREDAKELTLPAADTVAARASDRPSNGGPS